MEDKIVTFLEDFIKKRRNKKYQSALSEMLEYKRLYKEALRELEKQLTWNVLHEVISLDSLWVQILEFRDSSKYRDIETFIKLEIMFRNIESKVKSKRA